MKKLASLLVFVFAFTITTQAQKGKHDKRMHKKDNLTTEQRATLSVKKLAMTLDLNKSQINKIKPLFVKQMKERTAMHKKMKAAKKDEKKRVVKADFAQMNKRLDAQIDFQSKMRSILTEKQYEKFKKLKKHGKRKMVKNKMEKKHKMRKHLKKEHN